jgi:hypothetical protein
MNANSHHEVTINSDRSTTIQIAICLLVAVVVAVSDIWRLVSGRVQTRVAPGTIIIAVAGLAALFVFRPLVLKLAFALMAIQASARVIVSYAHATVGVRQTVAVAAVTASLVAMLMVIFVIVNWFRSVVRRVARSVAEGPAS